MARLARDIDVAESLRSLAQHEEVVRWFAVQERAWIETVLTAEDENARVQAVARVHALRHLKAHLTAIDSAAKHSSQKLSEMRKTETNHA